MLLYILLARYLGPHNFGIYSIAVSYVTIFSLLSGFGIDSYLIKIIAGNPDKIKEYLSNSILIKLTGGLIAYSMVIACSIILSYDYITIIAISIFSLTLLFSPINNTYDAIFRGLQRMELCALLKICRTVFTLMIIGSMILLKMDLFFIVSAHVYTAIILIFLFYYSIIRRRYCSLSSPIETSHIKGILKGGYPFLITGAIYVLNSRTDVLMLSKLSNAVNVGIYDAANGLILVILIIPSLLSQALYPYLSQQFATRSNKLAEILNFVQWVLATVSVPISLGAIILAPKFIRIFYGVQYIDSVLVLQIIGGGLSIVFMRSIFGWVLAAIDKVNLMMWTNLMGFILNIFLNLLLIPKYHSAGAAIATTVSNVFATFIVMVVVKKQVPQSKNFLACYLKPIIPACFMAWFLLAFLEMNLFILIVGGAIIYISGYLIVFKGSDSQEIKILRKTMSHSKLSIFILSHHGSFVSNLMRYP